MGVMKLSGKGESLKDFGHGSDRPLNPKEFVGDIQDSKDRTHDRWRKTIVTLALVLLVAAMNWFVIDIVQEILQMDAELLKSKDIQAADRIVTESVILSLIGGTVAQVSALFLIAVKSIFSRKQK